jgi:hypothetical protein
VEQAVGTTRGSKRHRVRVAWAALGVVFAAAPAHATPERERLTRAADRYFAEENLCNAVYVGLGGLNVALGTALATRDDPALAGAGFPLIALGGAELVAGIVFLAATPGWRARAETALARAPAMFVELERDRMRSVEGAFVYYKLIDAAVVLTGLSLGIAGAASDDARLFGAGLGLGVGGVAQLTMEHITHDVARRYLDALERAPVALRW